MSGFQGIFQSDPVNKDTPILWGHGTADPIVPFRLQEVGAPQLKDLGLKVRTSCIALCRSGERAAWGLVRVVPLPWIVWRLLVFPHNCSCVDKTRFITLISSLPAKVTTKAYLGMPHSSCDQELADVGEFLRAVLKAD